MPTIDLAGTAVEYEVRHSSEATKPRIDAGINDITVVIPEDMDLDPAELLQEKQDWVLDKKEKYDDYLAKIPDREFEDGAILPFLGEGHTIRVVDQQKREIRDGEIRLPARRVEESSIKEQVEKLYRTEVKQLIHAKVGEYIDRIDGDYDTLYIRDQKTKWGSCSGQDNLSFNWRLVMAPEYVLDYVVVHELAHLEHRDHSEQFWQRVNDLLPEYQKGMSWLEENSYRLVFNRDEVIS
ncbi:MAG: SprT family zinc-dependent metalloprotease [Candidatus Nanohaloarchaea archaeon]|nr:SprT family zinc-dependent metalloprotease [Candidatus Nanohaloarchaea archaeon]